MNALLSKLSIRKKIHRPYQHKTSLKAANHPNHPTSNLLQSLNSIPENSAGPRRLFNCQPLSKKST